MQLLIDCGNTNVVFALFDGDENKGNWRIFTDFRRSKDEYASWFLPLIDLCGAGFRDISKVLISSVVPDVNHHLRGFSRHYFGVEPDFVNLEMAYKYGLKIDIEHPETLGADRIVNSITVVAENRYPAIIVDFGTATTFDVVDENGIYIGGAISPGVNLSMEALRQAAALLPKVSVMKPERVIGKNTVEAMRSGVFWGYAGLIEGMISRMKSEANLDKVTVISTGGLASVYEPHIDCINTLDKELTIRGLRVLAKDNWN